MPVSFGILFLYLPNNLAKKLLKPCFFFINAILSDFSGELIAFCEFIGTGCAAVVVLLPAALWAKVTLALNIHSSAITIKGNLLCVILFLNINQGQACPIQIKTKPVDFVELIFTMIGK